MDSYQLYKYENVYYNEDKYLRMYPDEKEDCPDNEDNPFFSEPINISLDIKSTVANKGVRIMARYPNKLQGEDKPQNAPEGFHNPNFSGPTETIPENPPADILTLEMIQG